MAIDVGAPTFSSHGSNNFYGTNFSTAMRFFFWDDDTTGIADEDGAIQMVAPGGIHGVTSFQITSPSLDTAHLRRNIHLLNPIGYNNKSVTQVLKDFLIEQMHVGHGIVRLNPSGDGTTSQWTPSTLGGKWARIDEPMDDPDLNDYIFTVTAGGAQDLTFPALPSNALWAIEALVAFYGAMTKGPSGSDEGLGFGFQMQHAIVGNLSRKLIGDMYAGGSINAQRVKLERIDQLPEVFNAGVLHVTAERGSAGASPNPKWYIYTLEMVVYYSINEAQYDVIDAGAFSALDANYTTHLMDFDLIDTTGYQALLDILAHAPQLFLYVDYTGKLRPGEIDAYSDWTTKRPLSTEDGSIQEVLRGPYWYDERAANLVEVKWGVKTPSSPTEDPTNQPGDVKYRRGASSIPVVGWEDIKPLDRHFVRGSSNKDVAEAIAAHYLELWGKRRRGVRALDLALPYSSIDVEPGDVVAITVSNLGYSSTPFRCVEKSFDLDKGRILMTVYDVEDTL